MRKEFCAWLQRYAAETPNVIVLTGDLGFMALEPVREAIGDRFVNAGVSEQNMFSVAAALASEGLRPFCYSIAPFAVFRATEQIRLDIAIHGLQVHVVGNGGGYGYGVQGATHHALEDIAVMSSFPHMHCFVPMTGADVAPVCDAMVRCPTASYLRLNMGQLPDGFALTEPFSPMRRIRREADQSKHRRLTVLGLGPIVLNTLRGLPDGVDVFVVSQVPLAHLSDDFIASVRETGKLVVVEEHVQRGGLAEHVALHLLREGLHPEVTVRTAMGYPSKTYGSQLFHQRESGIDPDSLSVLIRERVNGNGASD